MRSPARYDSRGTCSRTGQDRLGAAEVDDDVAALEAAHDAGDELALAVLVLVEDVLALGLADALEDDLLGGLRGDAAERLPGPVQVEQVAELLVLLLGLGLILLGVEDLEQELVAELGLEAEALRRRSSGISLPSAPASPGRR